ncbi:MAG: diacylglycerol kinase family protein [Sphingomonadales bacterium]
MTVLRRKYFTLIHNPTAGPRRLKKLSSVVSLLEDRGAVVEILHTRAVGHASELACEHIGKTDAVVAVGGDGTLAEVIGGVVGSGQPMGLIPMGTANSAAIDMGLASRIKIRWSTVIDTLLNGDMRPLYVGRVSKGETSRYFILMVGIGFDGVIVRDVSHGIKQRWGKWAYARTGLATFASFQPAQLQVDSVDAQWVIATNGQFYGGPFQLSQEANLLKPGLKVLAVTVKNKWQLLRALFDLACGRLESQNYVRCLSGNRFEIKSQDMSDIPAQVDGDFFGNTPVHVESVEKPLSFLLPGPIDKKK